MGHARALITIPEADRQLWVFREIIDKGLSVRKVEELVRQVGSEPEKKAKRHGKLPYEYRKIADGLSSRFGTKVQLKIDTAGKGRINIPMLSRMNLTRILAIIG